MNKCILVVDDDGDVRELMCRMLEREGYRTVSAKDGREALETVGRLVPDLVVTDVIMPGMDGLAMLLELRHRAPELGTLVVTGGGRAGADAHLETARRLGARAGLRKPFTREEMLDAVRRALAPRSRFETENQE